MFILNTWHHILIVYVLWSNRVDRNLFEPYEYQFKFSVIKFNLNSYILMYKWVHVCPLQRVIIPAGRLRIHHVIYFTNIF